MPTIISALTLIVLVVLLWAGIKKPRVNRFFTAVITFLDFVLLVAAVVFLGWLGLFLFVATTVVAALVTAARVAMRKETLLVHAATQFGCTKTEAYRLFDDLPNVHRVWRHIGHIERAEFIAAVSERGRSPHEAREILTPIALVWIGDLKRMSKNALTGDFDRLLRLADRPATEAMVTADVIVDSARKSAATVSEMLRGLLAYYNPNDPARAHE